MQKYIHVILQHKIGLHYVQKYIPIFLHHKIGVALYTGNIALCSQIYSCFLHPKIGVALYTGKIAFMSTNICMLFTSQNWDCIIQNL